MHLPVCVPAQSSGMRSDAYIREHEHTEQYIVPSTAQVFYPQVLYLDTARFLVV